MCVPFPRVSCQYIRRRWLPGDRAWHWPGPCHEFNSDVYVSDITHDDEGNVYILAPTKDLLINPDVEVSLFTSTIQATTWPI